MKDFGRIGIGILAVLAINTLLSHAVPAFYRSDRMPLDPLLMVYIQTALQFFVAVTVGAVVARRKFIGPALTLAILGWCIIVYIEYDIARTAVDESFLNVMLPNLPGLFLYAVAAVCGAILGRKLYDNASAKRTVAT